jgi:hypothetical protein
LTIEELPLRLPPLFAEACGYEGKARYVALCWIPELRELWWSDDGHATIGVARSFLVLCSHPATADTMRGYQDLTVGGELRPWLLIDRDRRTLSMGRADQVWEMLESQSVHGRRPAIDRADPRRQRQMEDSVRAWLDWMGNRNGSSHR